MADAPLIFIRFTSHRARQNAFDELSRTPQGYWSLTRKTHPGGVYAITREEVLQLRAAHAYGIRFTLVRGPWDDLMTCWS